VLVDGSRSHVVAEELVGERREQVWQRVGDLSGCPRLRRQRAGNREIGVFLLRAADGNRNEPERHQACHPDRSPLKLGRIRGPVSVSDRNTGDA